MQYQLDWKDYFEKSAEVVAEGQVLLRNNGVLPLDKNKKIAVFGRIQLDYYKSGTGSGGMVNVPYVVTIVDGLRREGIEVEETLYRTYVDWVQEHPFDVGTGWGMEPWCQEEMSLSDRLLHEVAEKTDTALVIIGRTAGEEQDNKLEEGSFLLTLAEKTMLEQVRCNFDKMVVVLNVGNIMDTEVIEDLGVDALLYAWQGGMAGGLGTARVLSGAVNPSGKLPDTVAKQVSDYSSDAFFGGETGDCYAEDIYVGYRYFATFAPQAVKYPFGYGLSYTTFAVETEAVTKRQGGYTCKVQVTNTGAMAGKEVVQVYVSAPQGELGKPEKVLAGFAKTKLLEPGETQQLVIEIREKDLASYDDSGCTGHPYCFVLEKGNYRFMIGTDASVSKVVAEFAYEETIVIEQLSQALAPVRPFKRMKPAAGQTQGEYEVLWEEVPLLAESEEKRREQYLPGDREIIGDQGWKLQDVLQGKVTMEQFISQLSKEELNCLVRGEGMGSPRVTAGTASAFGGVSDALTAYGIPCGCCADGPSGMRLDCGTKAFSIANGTLIASTFDPALVEELFTMLGTEMTMNRVDCLLGPGMNIHRHPLNGRNFEYFSEDPYLTGSMASAELRGLNKAGVDGAIKHFCANNQETNRHELDSVISERALREIYLKGFEMTVEQGCAHAIMTTYGAVNGLWNASNFDLTTTILREQWGFDGFVMTDWWANINERNKPIDKNNFAAMVRAQNDVYMVCSDGSKGDDNVMEALENGSLTLGELQRCAGNVCRFLLHTHAMERMMGQKVEVELLNAPEDADAGQEPVVFYDLYQDQGLELDLSEINTDKGKSYSFALTVHDTGYYNVTLTASSDAGELAQIPVTLFSLGTAQGTFTWNGTGGKPVSFTKEVPYFSRFTTMRLYFANSGLKMHSIKIEIKQLVDGRFS